MYIFMQTLLLKHMPFSGTTEAPKGIMWLFFWKLWVIYHWMIALFAKMSLIELVNENSFIHIQ